MQEPADITIFSFIKLLPNLERILCFRVQTGNKFWLPSIFNLNLSLKLKSFFFWTFCEYRRKVSCDEEREGAAFQFTLGVWLYNIFRDLARRFNHNLGQCLLWLKQMLFLELILLRPMKVMNTCKSHFH